MLKTEFLTFLKDADICKEIFEIIRHSGKPTGSTIPETARQSPSKVEFLNFLHDADICKEIFNIILRGGKPDVEVAKPKAMFAGGTADAVAALRQRVRDQLTNKTSTTEPGSQQLTKFDTPEKRVTALGDRLALLKDKEHSLKLENAFSKEEAPVAIDDGSYTFVVDRNCPVCGMKTRIVMNKVRLVAETIDFDFCVHYKNFNPYLYTIWVCEHCGYSADDVKFQERLPERTRKSIKEFLDENNFKTPFVETRTKEEALTLYEMAIYFNKIFEKSLGRQALLYQKMAWLCRIEHEEEKEREYLLKTAELFEQSVNSERYPIGKVGDDLATFTIGVNYYLLGDFEKATRFLGSIINSNQMRISSPKLYERTRDIWQDLRQMKSARR
ncbi:MAG: DUF2225 domain-containing protein [Selenomonadaceae bacterium]|nr:DUF2225 domain-containing protein [Selenomonadaceae bacterium]